VLEDRERKFVSQSEEFVATALHEFRAAGHPCALPQIAERPSFPIPPILIESFRSITPDQRRMISDAYYGETGVAYCIILDPTDPPAEGHPLLDLAAALAGDLPLRFP